MTVTSNLGLSVYDVASGSVTTFQTFRLAIAGLTGNMSLIDSYAGAASGSIANLKLNSPMNVSFSLISPNYFESTNSLITGYSTNLIINLKLNSSITGSTTININSFGVITLKKIDSSGNAVNLISGDLIANKYYFFIYNGSYFVLIGNANNQYEHGCSIYSSSPINISGSTPLTFTSENYDTDNFFSGSTSASKIVIPTGYDGYYHVSFNGEWGTSGSGYYYSNIIRSDNNPNVVISESGALISAGSFVTKKFCMSGNMYMNSGCSITVYAGQNTAGSTIALNAARLSIDYLGQ